MSTVKDASKSKGKAKMGPPLVARMTNLVTSDLQHLTGIRNFLIPMLNVPLNLALSTAFLYYVLGWSAFAGLAVMVALLSMPAWAGKQVRGVMKKVCICQLCTEI
jgi:hypothetical protein